MNTYNKLLMDLINDLTDSIEEKHKDNPDIDDIALNNAAKKISKKHFKYFENNKDILLNENKSDTMDYNDYLYSVWKNAFDILELIIGIVTEAVEIYSNTFGQKAQEDDNMLYLALRTIHARALLTSKECLLLLKNGYPNGAFSLWRTIYELSIISDLLYSRQDYDLCKRYVDYYHIQIYREEKANRNNGYPIFTEKGFKNIKKNYEFVKKEYGENFDNGSYGWANSFFNKKCVYFSDIENKSNMKRLKGYYNASCTFIHGNHKANYSPLGLMPNSNPPLVIGPSDYGLSIPMQCVAISLVNITIQFIGTYPTVNLSPVCLLLKDLLEKLMKKADSIQKSIEESNKASN